ncbi:MAG: glycoside hydrolase/phage tail family protein [Pseudomonadota bacterium]
MRLSGQIIWSSRYLENVRTTTQGGKATGGQRVREFSYTISFAVGLCEGPIDRVGRIWADGQLLDTQDLTFRLYRGDEDQLPDPKISAVEGDGTAPAYRGLAYIVFEDLPVERFGNRIPQLNFEVFRAPPVEVANGDEEQGSRLRDLVRGVALSPGSGEFSLDTEPVQYVFPQGGNQYANVNNSNGVPDILQSLDELDFELPDCDSVSLIVSWFGTDLRCGECLVEPRIEEANRASRPNAWRVAGLTTATARTVSLDPDGRPSFGGTPSDLSVIRAIRELKARGKKVMIYPFLLMDIAQGNALTNPYTGDTGQPVFPWRGRITGSVAPGVAGSPDQSLAMTAEVDAFFGTAAASDFAVATNSVTYTGPQEFRWRRFILHMAALAAAAGGVDSICIGSELRGLTTLRSDRQAYPAVDRLIDLAAEVRQILPAAKIGYAADWSEYFGHQPPDGSGDAIFHLDPLWADREIDFVGIDDYTPLSDWRHQSDHLDRTAGAPAIYSLPYLSGNVEGGEYYDFFYASEAARAVQDRTPIADGAHGEDWIYRPKDIRNWWSNPHHNRIGGVREQTPTSWVPESKPVWLTETGCPAIDLGANTPNLFFDPKSSESALPFGSVGARDDEMQRRFLQAKLGYWQEPGNNPVSSVYAGPMIPDDRVFVWTWDARPWPDFPVRESVWSDGPSHRMGHWLTGRVSASALSEVVADICRRRGFERFDVRQLFGVVDGYLIENVESVRAALEPLMLAHGFDVFEGENGISFRMRDLGTDAVIATDKLVAADDPREGPISRERASSGAEADLVRLNYVQAEGDYRASVAESQRPDGTRSRTSETSLALALPASKAQVLATRWLSESTSGEESVTLSLPNSMLDLEPGDIISLSPDEQARHYRIDALTDGLRREVRATQIDQTIYLPASASERVVEPELTQPPGPVEATFLDLPLPGRDGSGRARMAVGADPWPGEAAIYSSAQADGFGLAAQIRKSALVGVLQTLLPQGRPNLWQRVSVDVAIPRGGVSSAEPLSVLNGANLAALELPGGEWELLQFQFAELVGPGLYRLSTLLRGLRGTDALEAGPVPAGARLLIVDDALAELPLSVGERGLPRFYRVGPAQFGFSHPSYIELTETFRDAALRPFAPAHLRADGQLGSDIALSWIRQTRIDGDNWEGFDVPLGEEREHYRVQIRQSDNLLREIETPTSHATYTAGMQAQDGAAPGIEIGVAQLSNAYGYGSQRRILIDG